MEISASKWNNKEIDLPAEFAVLYLNHYGTMSQSIICFKVKQIWKIFSAEMRMYLKTDYFDLYKSILTFYSLHIFTSPGIDFQVITLINK